ncbi:hypothetical protein M434DRAFT_102820 [Hypoxylon sp. CO27-5]|nr:hypothetical protein M434DRAFT_102820 [Hypoxylon sp. CO27-5]
MSSSTEKHQVRCHLCNKSLTKRSFGEHAATTHLGVTCYFPGCDFKLDKEDDSKMTEALIHANEQRGETRTQNEEGKDIYWCRWPNCRSEGQDGHSYGSPESLRRHLRTKQRDMLKKFSPDWNVNPRILDAWDKVNRQIAIRDAKFESLRVVVQPSLTQDQTARDICNMIFAQVQEANTALDAEIQRVKNLTYINEATDIWDDFTNRDDVRKANFLSWSSSLNFNVSPDYDPITWQYFRNEHAALSEMLERLKQMTTGYPDVQNVSQG